jgi:hypothetical protein
MVILRYRLLVEALPEALRRPRGVAGDSFNIELFARLWWYGYA